MPVPTNQTEAYRQQCGYSASDDSFDALINDAYDGAVAIVERLGQSGKNSAELNLIYKNMVAHLLFASGAGSPGKLSAAGISEEFLVSGGGEGWLATTMGATANRMLGGLLADEGKVRVAVVEQPQYANDNDNGYGRRGRFY